MRFVDGHLSVLKAAKDSPPPPWSGEVPVAWRARVLNTTDSRPSSATLTALEKVGGYRHTREQLRAVCTNKDVAVLVAYICTMAWGKQGAGGKVLNARRAWARQDSLTRNLVRLRNDKLSRAQAFELFAGDNRIPGLGPAYSTKLLFFFAPPKTNYIMDQWTAKSMILLTGCRNLVQMNRGDGPSARNSGENYERYCEAIENLAALLKLQGYETEELIFSNGGRNPGMWRAHVKKHWTD